MAKNATSFKTGNKSGKGRARGSKNRVTVLREGFLEALNREGGVEWLQKQARENPKAFLSALCKANPAQLEVEHKGSITVEIVC